jgi:maltose alpha-D-glucosyltransferase/alpha-amylase
MREHWYKDAIIYSLDVETFLDSNGDGIGDFPGLTSALDHIAGLGVNCIWLQPFHPSPNRDDGYDVTDYYAVDPRFGTLGDFVEFVHQAEQRGIRILIDLVVNHTSDKHPWFQSARSDPRSPYRKYYLWRKSKPKKAPGPVFPGVQDSTWTFDRAAGAWYFHRFYKHQPDLNVGNPAVREEIERIIGFWLALGVAGFRLDAVPFLIGLDEPPHECDPFEYLQELREFVSFRRGDAVLLAEANVTPEDAGAYFGSGEKLHMLFSFWLNQHLFLALARERTDPLIEALRQHGSIPRIAQWANFLRGHDELDLGRLRREEREDVFRAFGPKRSMQIYERGIRRRLAPMLEDRARLELANSLLLALPGTPVIRYGDEIGMGDDLSLRERLSVRTPMQWSDEPNAGFSRGPRGQTVRPIISRGAYSYRRVNVADQQRDPTSLLNWTERALRIRAECPEIGRGTFEVLDTGCPSILAMRHRWHDRTLITLHNLAKTACAVQLDLGDKKSLAVIFDPKREHRRFELPTRIELPPYGYSWARVE